MILRTRPTKLTATTPHGVFTRKTGKVYTHVAVYRSTSEGRGLADTKGHQSISASWHHGEELARKGAMEHVGSFWYHTTELLGVYAVDQNG